MGSFVTVGFLSYRSHSRSTAYRPRLGYLSFAFFFFDGTSAPSGGAPNWNGDVGHGGGARPRLGRDDPPQYSGGFGSAPPRDSPPHLRSGRDPYRGCELGGAGGFDRNDPNNLGGGNGWDRGRAAPRSSFLAPPPATYLSGSPGYGNEESRERSGSPHGGNAGESAPPSSFSRLYPRFGSPFG